MVCGRGLVSEGAKGRGRERRRGEKIDTEATEGRRRYTEKKEQIFWMEEGAGDWMGRAAGLIQRFLRQAVGLILFLGSSF